jgi:hypothetical protein
VCPPTPEPGSDGDDDGDDDDGDDGDELRVATHAVPYRI